LTAFGGKADIHDRATSTSSVANDPKRSYAGSKSRNAAGWCNINEDGPQKGAPVLVQAGMMGDCAT
jgi:hypothetical protein